jgi:hypothetical protein
MLTSLDLQVELLDQDLSTSLDARCPTSWGDDRYVVEFDVVGSDLDSSPDI